MFLIFIFNLFFSTLAFADKLVVTVIHSYEKGMWSIHGTEGVRKSLVKNGISHLLYEEIYDYTKIKNDSEKSSKQRDIAKRILLNSTNLIIIFDDEAADSLVPALNELNIPIVLTGINKNLSETTWYRPEGHPKRNFTGILERYPFEQSLKMLKTINPLVNKISILTSKNETSRIVTSHIKQKFKNYHNKYHDISLEKIHFTDSWDEWQRIIRRSNLPNRAFWILVPWNVNDKNGNEVDLRVIGEFYRKNSKIPEIGIVNINDKLGFLASFSVGSEDLGVQAGELGIKIFQKKIIPKDHKFVHNSLVRFVINKKRADSLNIKIPNSFLDFAKIEKKIPMEYFR